MSQCEFSKLLGVDRIHYGHAEAGIRPLNIEAGIQLLHVKKYFQQKKDDIELHYTAEEIEMERQRLQVFRIMLTAKFCRLEEKLTKMEAQRVEAMNAWQLCTHLKELKLLDNALAEKMALYARSKIFANGRLYQDEVRAQLLLLSAEDSSIIQRLENLSKIQSV